MADDFACYLVTKTNAEKPQSTVTRKGIDELPAGDVLVRVAYSSLNFKDALSAAGHPGVTRKFPHVPGIDAAGSVVESNSPEFKVGQKVLITGHDMGQNTWGGFAEYVRVPVSWVMPMPDGLNPRDAMIYGTAGLTAALCVAAIERQGISPASGDVLVTGASGGVGSIAVAILAHIGYKVVASTGKAERHDFLKQLGATSIIGRDEVDDKSGKPMLAPRWAAAVDTVGGNTLTTIVRSLQYNGCVAACGLVGGTELPLSVYPFILRGAMLAGIDSVECPPATRDAMWRKLAGRWRPQVLEAIAREEVDLDHLGNAIDRIAAGRIVGRVVVRP
ncbi:MAG TPA: YhdH/YhfP family quinone oxidoreductase [Pirellulales bacterium]|jgi:putative YhdH/YhfP family quinone oxidoreductase|nr:YhdH/YhfP family quinone oxidoreductase [Pirellulales bacterium]